MPQSLAMVLVHVVFSTKDRRPVLTKGLRPELFRYLATIVRDNGCQCYRIGGVEDHVHIAVRLSFTMNVADLMSEMKSSSSRWLKDDIPEFAWQRGYGAFSVSASSREALLEYIDKQEEHHRKFSFQDEFRKLCKRYGLDLDERYAWE